MRSEAANSLCVILDRRQPWHAPRAPHPYSNAKDSMTTDRIYVVSPKAAEGAEKPARRLVRAPNQAQALRHVAKDLQVTVASQDDLVELVAAGVKVEASGTQP